MHPVLEMLQIAATAAGEVRTGGLASSRPGDQELENFGPAVIGLALEEADSHPVARRRAGHEDRDAFEPAEAIAARDELLVW